MKLFIWHDPIDISYGGSVLAVMAKTEAAARKKAANVTVSQYGTKCLLGEVAAARLGPPDEVLDGKNGDGFIYRWEE